MARRKAKAVVIGLDELSEKFQQMIKNVSEEQLEHALNAAGLVLTGEMKRTAAFQDKTGYLRKSIGIRLAHKKRKELVVHIGSRAPHAHLIEFGHGGPQPAPAHPFIRPAFDMARKDILEMLEIALTKMTEPPK